ncbi:acyl--CoA ligase [Legionella antarctica]|uniref:Acyl--CoA ligase n=1 Tax=Legionella antarctica TaxID=2708020 RepID=A0A6F8T229_9GAMM|nr:class I adenylate-forming enzyme family protein [Legionella antarctica]BCA94227.1 acyl--CoA ligase [Legionella antarctica]
MQLLSPRFATNTALSSADQNLSFAQLDDAIEQMSQQLKKLPEGILILKAAATPLFVIQLLAAFNIEKPVALSSEQDLEQRKLLLGTCMTVNFKGELINLYENSNMNHHPQLALVLFTSGTTGQVKAVQLSAQNILVNCHSVMKALEFSRVQNQLLFLPLTYSFGLLGQLLPGLVAGITTKLISQFTDIKMLLETGEIPQMWSGVPSHWVAISRMASFYPESAAQITAIISAGAPLVTPLRASLKQTFPNAVLYNNYGLTEASPRVLTYSSKDPLFFDEYAGYPVGDWQIKLSENNELLLKGKQVMLGYLGEESLTRIQDGWLHTGDQAEVLPSGLVAIKGRQDTLVNIAGEKVNLTEIEQKFCQIDGIKEMIILPLKDKLYGVRLLVCLEQDPLTAVQTEQELAEQLRMHLLPKKLPIRVQFFEELPRTQHGKPDRKTLLLNYKDKDHAS